jgi:dihydroorotate dehydrogenase
MLNAELWTELSLQQWLNVEFPLAKAAAQQHRIPLIGSVGYTPEDLREIGPKVQAAGVDAIEFTIHYLDPKRIVDTARALRESVSVPIIAKFSPHAGDLGELAMTIDPYVDAYACINSVGPTLLINTERVEPVLGSEFGYGWLSGTPIKPIALRCVYEVARRTQKPVIGIGGIPNG